MKTATLERSTEAAPATSIATMTDKNRSVRKASFTAGVGLLLMSALSALGYLVAVKGLVTQGDATRTAKNIMDHEGLFRFGILSMFFVAILDVVVAWALYRVFRPVNEAISKLAAWLRIAYAAIFTVAISQLVGVVSLLNSSRHLPALSAHQVQVQAVQSITTFTNIWDAGLVLFGFNLLLVAYLAFRSEYVPRFVGVMLLLAGSGYLIDSFGRVLSRSSSLDVSAITGLGEFVFALWLVFRGRRIDLKTAPSGGLTSGATSSTSAKLWWNCKHWEARRTGVPGHSHTTGRGSCRG
jgi:hypothetical protein